MIHNHMGSGMGLTGRFSARARNAVGLIGMLGIVLTAARASTLSASVSNAGSGALCSGPILDSSTVPPPSIATAFAILAPPAVCCGSGTTSAFARGGEIGGRLQMSATGSSFTFDSQMSGCFDASMEIDDIVISGPGSEATIRVSIDVDGIISTAGNFPSDVLPLFRVSVELRGTDPSGFPTASPPLSIQNNFTVLTTLTTQPITVSTSQPVTVVVKLHVRGAVSPDAHPPATASIDADFSNDTNFSNTVKFTTGGPVFILPAGFTADSIDGNIVDNAFVPPCPGDSDGDNDVDLTDLANVLGDFGNTGVGLAGDVDDDGDVDLTDLAIVLANFGATCP